MHSSIAEHLSIAAKQVFSRMLGLDISVSGSDNKDTMAGENNVSFLVKVTGDLSGEILYNFPNKTALEIAKILTSMDFPEVDDFVTSALSEIANIISGNLATNLSEDELTCDIEPPQILSAVSSHWDGNHVSMVVNSSIGEYELELRID